MVLNIYGHFFGKAIFLKITSDTCTLLITSCFSSHIISKKGIFSILFRGFTSSVPWLGLRNKDTSSRNIYAGLCCKCITIFRRHIPIHEFVKLNIENLWYQIMLTVATHLLVCKYIIIWKFRFFGKAKLER